MALRRWAGGGQGGGGEGRADGGWARDRGTEPLQEPPLFRLTRACRWLAASFWPSAAAQARCSCHACPRQLGRHRRQACTWFAGRSRGFLLSGFFHGSGWGVAQCHRPTPGGRLISAETHSCATPRLDFLSHPRGSGGVRFHRARPSNPRHHPSHHTPSTFHTRSGRKAARGLRPCQPSSSWPPPRRARRGGWRGGPPWS